MHKEHFCDKIQQSELRCNADNGIHIHTHIHKVMHQINYKFRILKQFILTVLLYTNKIFWSIVNVRLR
jgi:hypothetical protein